MATSAHSSEAIQFRERASTKAKAYYPGPPQEKSLLSMLGHMRPDDQRKLRMIEHIVHDWAKLVEIYTAPDNRPPPLNHAVERAFLVESRKFAHFFRNNRGPLQEDAVSKDFVDVNRRFKAKLPVWKNWQDHINVHLMHLSYQRTDNTTPWTGKANEPIFEELCEKWNEFLQHVDPKFEAEFKRQRQAAAERAAFSIRGI